MTHAQFHDLILVLAYLTMSKMAFDLGIANQLGRDHRLSAFLIFLGLGLVFGLVFVGLLRAY